MIRAILRAQLLSMRFGGRGTAFSIFTGVIWYGLWAGISAILGLAAATFPAAELQRWLPVAFLGVCAYWQLVPVISASMGSALDMRKLLAYPIPHGRLFAVEVLLRLTTALEVILVVTAGTLGLLANPEAGGLGAAPRLLPAVLLFILFNLLLASGMRSILERLLSRRKVREMLAVLVAMIWVLPRFLISAGLTPKSLGGFGALVQATGFPWNAAAHGALGISVPAAMLSLCGWTLAAFWFGRTQFERSLRYDTTAAQATPAGPLPARTSTVERLLPASGAGSARPAGRNRGEGTPLARAHTALPHGLRHGLHVRPSGVVSGHRQPRAGARVRIPVLPDHRVRVRAHDDGAGFLLELFRLRPLRGSVLLRRSAADLDGADGKEPGRPVLHLPGGPDPGRPHAAAAPESQFGKRAGVPGGDRDLLALHAGAGKHELRALSAGAESRARLAGRGIQPVSGPGVPAVSRPLCFRCSWLTWRATR